MKVTIRPVEILQMDLQMVLRLWKIVYFCLFVEIVVSAENQKYICMSNST